MRVGSLFSGIGGLDLGLERAGMTVVWQSEVNPFSCRVLARHWPTVPNLGDITTIDWRTVEPVDVICGGFPCQDLSRAGQLAGIGGSRSGLWSYYADAVRVLRPSFVLVENVSDLLVRGMGRVVGDLAALGYDAEWDCLPAASVGAPHVRDRLFVVAYPHGRCGGRGEHVGRDGGPVPAEGLERIFRRSPRRQDWGPRPDRSSVRGVDAGLPAELDLIEGVIGEQADYSQAEPAARVLVWRLVRAVWEHRELAATSPDLYRQRLRDSVPELPHERAHGRWLLGSRLEADEELRRMWQRVCAQPFEEAQDLLPRMLERARQAQRPEAVGPDDRVARLRALGNAVVPAVAEHIGRRLMAVAA